MNITSYVLEQALKRLQFSGQTIREFRLASELSDVEGNGFPRELFHLSVPVVVRGLLNFALLQMSRDWIYPFWANRQLDPRDAAFMARAQNPLLINVTHRNWTACGTLHGRHEAIVDPRGLVTPLPREWSVDAWLMSGGEVFFPSRMEDSRQEIEEGFPCITTWIPCGLCELETQLFAGTTNHGLDVLFARVTVHNSGPAAAKGMLAIALRPFGPEGMAPIHRVEFKSPRALFVNDAVGLIFAESPGWSSCSSAAKGDLGMFLRKHGGLPADTPQVLSEGCDRGFAHAVSLFPFELPPGGSRSVHYSVALAEEKALIRRPARPSWRVGYDHRQSAQRSLWREELGNGKIPSIDDRKLRKIFDAQRLLLLELHDRDFISPGPYLYHHFWFRDAVAMVRALDALGFHKRAREVIDGFPARVQGDGFFRAPAGEWDSNGAVLWAVLEHYRASPSDTWLRKWFPMLERGARWIARKRKQSGNGLLPRSLSAEHLGTADQYYWDSFWSLAGLRSVAEAAHLLGREGARAQWENEARGLETDILTSFRNVEERIGEPLIPATPSRNFDESAIGSICAVYPLRLFGADVPQPRATVLAIRDRYVDERGFYHPIVHSGYNPYLTLQVAHSLLLLGEKESAWNVAHALFSRMSPPYSLPEAIHPRTGGGSMGDGHHGWAAAEIVLFLLEWMKGENVRES